MCLFKIIFQPSKVLNQMFDLNTQTFLSDVPPQPYQMSPRTPSSPPCYSCVLFNWNTITYLKDEYLKKQTCLHALHLVIT